jgi:hypothetical protein
MNSREHRCCVLSLIPFSSLSIQFVRLLAVPLCPADSRRAAQICHFCAPLGVPKVSSPNFKASLRPDPNSSIAVPREFPVNTDTTFPKLLCYKTLRLKSLTQSVSCTTCINMNTRFESQVGYIMSFLKLPIQCGDSTGRWRKVARGSIVG